VEVSLLAVCDIESPELVAWEDSSVFVADDPVGVLVAPPVMVTRAEPKSYLPKVVVFIYL
jgi:hypothetical protein